MCVLFYDCPWWLCLLFNNYCWLRFNDSFCLSFDCWLLSMIVLKILIVFDECVLRVLDVVDIGLMLLFEAMSQTKMIFLWKNGSSICVYTDCWYVWFFFCFFSLFFLNLFFLKFCLHCKCIFVQYYLNCFLL